MCGMQKDKVHSNSSSRGTNETYGKCTGMTEKSLKQNQIPQDTSKSSAHAVINSQMAERCCWERKWGGKEGASRVSYTRLFHSQRKRKRKCRLRGVSMAPALAEPAQEAEEGKECL